ncbi:hypothetical protein GH714_008774 [Hevea brasiliensis]|uniref:Uncharacterized protein n=1 Tax=Hevea brasiliensis TaxID=3981 RepID=A0A6A6L0A4_HEVBR|nr:hypothetical protein GH714_008774 [Hevea brasiliensis]
MIKRTPSRNARTRGFKVKNVLQICLLLGVCFWLIYQVKHSHDKKKEFDEKESKISVKTQSEKIGEADLEEDFVDEGKEREEEGEEKESGHDEAGDKEAQVDDETSMEDQDHDEGVQNDHEAREEHYKADDASSAVHDTQTISTEPEKVSSENLEANDLELEKNSNNNNTNDVNGDQKNSKSQLGEGVTAENDSQLNMKAGEKMDDEIINTEDQSTKNATIVPVSNGQPELSNNSMDVNTEAGNETSSSSQHNEIGVTSDSNQAQNAKIATEEASNLKTTELEQVNSNTIADSGETDSNSSVPDKTENIDNSAKDSNSSTNSEPSGSDKLIKMKLKLKQRSSLMDQIRSLNLKLKLTLRSILGHLQQRRRQQIRPWMGTQMRRMN